MLSSSCVHVAMLVLTTHILVGVCSCVDTVGGECIADAASSGSLMQRDVNRMRVVGLEDTCESVWDAPASGHTCGERITWMMTDRRPQMNEIDARVAIAGEHPGPCGPCAFAHATPAPPAPAPRPPLAPPASGRALGQASAMSRHTIETGNRANIGGVSDMVVAKDGKLIALKDQKDKHWGAVCAAAVAKDWFDSENFQLRTFAWEDEFEFEGTRGCEGLALASDGTLYMSTEDYKGQGLSRIYKVSENVRTWTTRRRILHVQPLEQELPSEVKGKSGSNQGVESLAMIDDARILIGFEGPLDGDDPQTRRILERDVTTGALLASRVIVIPDDEEGRRFELKELSVINSLGLAENGEMLALFSAWKPHHANERSHVRIYHLRAQGATDVGGCNHIERSGGGDCSLDRITPMTANLVLDWDCKERGNKGCPGPLTLPDGTKLESSNYEGMALLPTSKLGKSYTDFGGIPLMIINDNNYQHFMKWTEFVLLKIPYT